MPRTLRTAAALATLFAFGHAAGAQAATIASQSFTSEGEHAFVVPAGVTSVQVTLVGGNGGAGKGGASGGIPATVTAQLAVTPGETLYAEVAGNGQTASGAQNAGGYGGGGGGGESGFGGVGGGGGGGASDLRTCPASAPPSACGGRESRASRLLVAGGGGGGGGHGIKPESAAGGNGGSADQSGSAGQKDELLSPGGTGGTRGTPSAGGEAGGPNPECERNGKGCPTTGQLGGGGSGGSGAFGGGGGGGGAGVYGGGGGGAGGFAEGFLPTAPAVVVAVGPRGFPLGPRAYLPSRSFRLKQGPSTRSRYRGPCLRRASAPARRAP
jgi:Glycine rich protein